jgi:hypothetical protein
MEASKAGHLKCLERMKREGWLLTSNSEERKSAGEVRKAELWDAALVAGEAEQVDVLKWLFRDGWPASVDATSEFSLSGLARPLEPCNMEELYIPCMRYRDEWFLAEVNLCRFALRSPNTACLEALLDAGCRSEWMCPMAVLEGGEAHLALAASRGCCCDARTLYVAARAGNLSMLRAAHRNATDAKGLFDDFFVVHDCIHAAVKGGSEDCLCALLDWFQRGRYLSTVDQALVKAGRLAWLQELMLTR